MVEPVFVQPHFDDVALSCGGAVAAQAETGRARIVTIFGGEPPSSLSAFARFQHERWQLSDAQVVALRRAEDARAAAELGAGVGVTTLDYLDAIYRRPAYASDEALFGAPVASDLELVDALADALEGFGDRFVLPLAVGNHVDHQLAFRAGVRLSQRGHEVWLYADLPYALDDDALQARLRVLGDPAPCVFELSPAQFDRRWRAIECYVSQLPVLFRDLPGPRERFKRFGNQAGTGGPVEMFWRMDAIEGRET